MTDDPHDDTPPEEDPWAGLTPAERQQGINRFIQPLDGIRLPTEQYRNVAVDLTSGNLDDEAGRRSPIPSVTPVGSASRVSHRF